MVGKTLGMLALDGDQEPTMLAATAAHEAQGRLSPDGRRFKRPDTGVGAWLRVKDRFPRRPSGAHATR